MISKKKKQKKTNAFILFFFWLLHKGLCFSLMILLERRLSLYWCGFVAGESSSRALESCRHGQFHSNDNERSILINGSSHAAAIVWQLTFDFVFFSPRQILFLAIRIGVSGFSGGTRPCVEPISPVIKEEEHISCSLLLGEGMKVRVKSLFWKRICLFCVWETNSPAKSHQSVFHTHIYDIFVLVVLQADSFV